MIVNSNLMSLFARRATGSTTNGLMSASARLSSGLRINRAGDDAAGLAISERMTSSINGNTQAKRNVNDGISVTQTAEGALGTASDLLQRIRLLAVQSANGTNSDADRRSLQAEVKQLVAEFDRVGRDTEFNSLKLLDGSSLTTVLQVGDTRNQAIMTGVQSTRVVDLYSYALSSDITSTASMSAAQAATSDGSPAQRNRLQAQNLNIYAKGQVGTVVLQAGVSAKEVAERVNSSLNQKGMVAARAETYALLTIPGNNSAILNFKINGSSIQAASGNSSQDMDGVIQAINNASAATGVVASHYALTGGSVGVLLHAAQGEDVKLTEMSVALGATGGAAGSVGTVGVQGLYDAGNNVFGSVGAAVTLTAGTNTASRNTTVGGRVLMANDSAFTLSHNAAGSTGGLFSYPPTALVSCVKGGTLNDLDLSTVSTSNTALSVVDAILNRVNSYRSALGAMQNRLDLTQSSLSAHVENISGARSRVRDADFGLETSLLARAQLLQQAGLAMTSQANAGPKRALELLG